MLRSRTNLNLTNINYGRSTLKSGSLFQSEDSLVKSIASEQKGFTVESATDSFESIIVQIVERIPDKSGINFPFYL
ncbi:MAG: hypothetical protein ACJAT0_002652 [Nonlabens sp.]|jgi:hypothetical protein|uniref:hypothetical protein n=1 Tax=Nonlabens sp. TaxID=1888209 RepID=UPI0039E3B163